MSKRWVRERESAKRTTELAVTIKLGLTRAVRYAIRRRNFNAADSRFFSVCDLVISDRWTADRSIRLSTV